MSIACSYRWTGGVRDNAVTIVIRSGSAVVLEILVKLKKKKLKLRLFINLRVTLLSTRPRKISTLKLLREINCGINCGINVG